MENVALIVAGRTRKWATIPKRGVTTVGGATTARRGRLAWNPRRRPEVFAVSDRESDGAEHTARTLHEEVIERVYDHEVAGEGGHRMEGEVARAEVRDIELRSRVDDITDGKVALVTFSDDPECSSYTRLPAEAAKELGEALIAASEYAEGTE